MDDIVVSIPARAEGVRVLRSVVASVASLRDASYDAIEDLRIAVDEACAFLLSAGKPATILSLTVRPSDEGIEVEASSDGSPTDWPPVDGHYSITWQVLSAVTDEVRVELPDGRPTVWFVKRLSESR